MISQFDSVFANRKFYSDVDDCIAVCAMQFPMAAAWQSLSLMELIDWTHRAIEILEAKAKQNHE